MAKKKRPLVDLGRPARRRSDDLESLFSADADTEQAAGLQLLALRLDAIVPDPNQPRRTFDDDSLSELRDSIKQDGVIQPIEVTQIGPNKYRLVHGERRWRAAQLAGLETVPAIVQRRDYDEITRFVRQLVENIQREDLNDVDRAAGLLHLRELMQDELEAARSENIASDEPWGSKVTWSKVGKRLGYSRQRIHQLTQLLKLPDELIEAVRDGGLSERDSRMYQGLKASQQRALFRAQSAGDLSQQEARLAVRMLKESPDKTLATVLRTIRNPEVGNTEHSFTSSFDKTGDGEVPAGEMAGAKGATRVTSPSAIDRLEWIRGHLARVQRHGLSPAERKESLRLLKLIQQDVASLIAAIETDQDNSK